MPPRLCRLAVAGLLGVLAVGCGAESDGSSSPVAAPPGEPTQEQATDAPPDMERFLLQADELPGLTPVLTPHTDSGEPFDLPAEGTELLERTGYVSTTYQPAEGDTSAGVSSVMLFETAEGAQEWMAYETSDEVILYQIPNAEIERFEVPGIPGANGWTGPDLHGNSIGHLFWTQGRCMMLLGLEVEGPRVERLSAGATSIYERTAGTCPD